MKNCCFFFYYLLLLRLVVDYYFCGYLRSRSSSLRRHLPPWATVRQSLRLRETRSKGIVRSMLRSICRRYECIMGKQCVYTVHRNFYSSTSPKSSDLAEYEELRQLKDIKSKSFYEEEGTRRNYFYYIDLQGRLFLEDTVPKNIATSLKSDKFLNFFFRQLKDNNTNKFGEYPYFSPCGNESNL